MLNFKKIIIGLALISLPFKASSNIQPANIVFDAGNVLVTPSYTRSLDYMKYKNIFGFAFTSPIQFWTFVAHQKQELFNVFRKVEGIDTRIEGATYVGEPLPPVMCAHQIGHRDLPWQVLLKKTKEAIDKQNFSESVRQTYHAMAEITFDPKVNASIMDIIPESFELVQECIDAGHEVFIVSNYNGDAFDAVVQLNPKAFGKFKPENIFVSGKKGIAKPDPNLWNVFKNEMSLKNGKVVFLDDQIENKPNADTGIDFIHHKKASTSRDELVKRGLLEPLKVSYKKKVGSGAAVTVILAACGITLYKLLHKDNKKQEVPIQA